MQDDPATQTEEAGYDMSPFLAEADFDIQQLLIERLEREVASWKQYVACLVAAAGGTIFVSHHQQIKAPEIELTVERDEANNGMRFTAKSPTGEQTA